MSIVSATSSQNKSGQFVSKVKVYDVDEKKLLYEFDSSVKAGKFLGITAGHVLMCIRKKCKNRTNNLGKTLAFR